MSAIQDAYFNFRPNLYYNATTSTSSAILDLSQGRAFNVNGDIFFSPNCKRTPTLPPSEFNPESLRDSFENSVQEFREPLWWHPTTAYLAFVPLELVFRGVPFQSLFSIPPYFDRVRRGFMLDTKTLLRWNVIQHELKFAVERLLSHHGAPKFHWIIPTALGCTGLYRNVRDLREKVTNSRDWFSVYVAGFSYAIAVSMTISNDPLDGGIPAWFYFLFGQQMEQLWLSGMQASSAGTFSPYVDRAGMLLKVLDSERGQFSVDWLCRFHVPVWYPWGVKEAQASISDRKIARLAPTPHQLQEINTFLTKTPGVETSMNRSHDPKPWVIFFAERALRNERIKEKETSKQRQSREDREKKPPTKKCRVYVWRRAGDGGYTRESIFQSENEEELDFYGRNQKVYDAFSNCWDLCDDFGAVEPDEFDANDDDEDLFPHCDPPSIGSPSHAPLTPHSQISPEPSLNPSQAPPLPPRQEAWQIPRIAASGYSYQRYETSQLLYDYLGFVHPLPLPLTLSSPLDSNAKKLVVAMSGLNRDDAEFFDSPVAPFAVEFLSALNIKQAPKNSSWDLASGNRLSVATAKRLDHLYMIYDDGDSSMEQEEQEEADSKPEVKLYLFDFKQAATVPWIIAVPDPTNALFLCRLDPQLTDYDLARELLNHGIRFHTLLPLPRIRPPPPTPICVPTRLPGYEFTPNDYHAYVQQRSALLADPRVARAALLRGGIVWRLAMATLSFDDVLCGPTTAAALHRRGVSFQTGDGSIELCDDGLSQDEYNIICGLHHCYTGEGKSFAIKSWWPLDSTWFGNTSHTHWTEKAEDMFDRRLGDLERKLEGQMPQPLDAQSWRSRIRATSNLRRVNKFMLTSSARFLANLPKP